MRAINILVKKNEEKIVSFVWINNKENEVTVAADLAEDGGSLILLGIFLGTKDDFLKFNTDVRHTALHTKSLTLIRAVFLGNASFQNDGIIRIKKGASDTNSYFDSKILLFDNAKGRSIPSLEIDENEVKAGHGSTIGRPDDEQLFYLRSRGLSEKAAEKLIITGFFEPALKLLVDSERKKITNKILKNITQ